MPLSLLIREWIPCFTSGAWFASRDRDFSLDRNYLVKIERVRAVLAARAIRVRALLGARAINCWATPSAFLHKQLDVTPLRAPNASHGCGLYLQPAQYGCGLYLEPVQ